MNMAPGHPESVEHFGTKAAMLSLDGHPQRRGVGHGAHSMVDAVAGRLI